MAGRATRDWGQIVTWESASELKLEEITGAWNERLFRSITPAEAHAAIGMLIDELRTRHFFQTDKDFMSDDDLERAFRGIGVWALAAWRCFTEATLDDLCSWLLRTLAEKQRCYGHGNIMRFGTRGICVRMNDKHERLLNMWATGHKSMIEPIEDSYMDLLGYSVIGLMVVDGVFELPLAKDGQ